MLYLTQPTDAPSHCAPPHGAPLRFEIAGQTAARLEQALLARDRAARKRELQSALASDSQLAGWALRAAEFRLGRTINRLEEAADWLSGCLETELASSLVVDDASAEPGGVEWRLAALAKRLGEYERALEDFQGRLEREKLASLKELAYGASHEINNPLANIASRAQTLLGDERDAERRRKLATIHRQAMRAHEMIADLMLFARPPKLNLATCEIGRLVTRVVDEHRDAAREHGVDLAAESTGEPIAVLADETQLGVAVHALVKNALEAVADGGHVWVAGRQFEIGAERRAEISVRDDGPGISEQVRRHMFDPFYSGREAGRGLGFGLSKCWRIVNGHGGQVVVQRSRGCGAEIAIRLPLMTAPAVVS
jgi:signal transduction histidine kinase